MELEKSNLNRSFSEPDIRSNLSYFRVIVEKIFHSDKCYKPMYYSCERIYDATKNITYTSENISFCDKTIQNCANSKLNNTLSLETQKENVGYCDVNYQSETLNNQKQKIQETPMEIDNSNTEECNDSDDEYICTNLKYLSEDEKYSHTLNTNYITSKPIRRLNETRKKFNATHQKGNGNIFVSIIIPVVLIAASVLISYYVYVSSENELIELTPENSQLIEKVTLDLNKVLYQDHVIHMVITNLKYLVSGSHNKRILAFAGSTGVGKTYTVNLIQKYFPTIHINFLLEYLNIDKTKLLISNDKCQLIIIDNLEIKHLEQVLLYIDKLPAKCALIVPIFNIHTADDHLIYTAHYDHFKKIKSAFSSEFSSNVNSVLFNNITRENVEVWLRKQIKERRLTNGEDIITSLLKEHKAQYHGFKGLIAKVNLLEEENEHYI